MATIRYINVKLLQYIKQPFMSVYLAKQYIWT